MCHCRDLEFHSYLFLMIPLESLEDLPSVNPDQDGLFVNIDMYFCHEFCLVELVIIVTNTVLKLDNGKCLPLIMWFAL